MRAFLALAVAISGASGLSLQFSKRALRGASIRSSRSASRYTFSAFGAAEENKDGTTVIGNVEDSRYTANITINGVDLHVALDTGSTDLWVSPPSGLGTFNNTGIPLKLLYGDGSYGVSGTIGVSEFEFGSYRVERQAFLNAEGSTVSGLTEVGIHGLLGLSFSAASASPINAVIEEIYGKDTTWGYSVLHNIFNQHPDQPNFIAIDLARTDDLEETDGGSFGIGEYDHDYASIANAPKLAQYPKGGDRWTTLLDGVTVDGDAVELKPTIAGVPDGHSLALLDTGDPRAIVPVYLLDSIYSRIPGSAPYQASAKSRVWLVPCNTTSSVVFIFGGQKFPVHPLDLTWINEPMKLEGIEGTHTTCVSTIQGADGWGKDAYEISLGDIFLRNVYSLYDFGDPQPDGTVGEPYMQLLSQIDPQKAAAQVAEIRAMTMQGYPPEIDPSTLAQILTAQGPAGAASTVSQTVIRPSSVNQGQDDGLRSTIASWGPPTTVVLVLLGVNIMVTLVLVVFVVLLWIRRGKASVNKNNSRYLPLNGKER